MTWSLTRCSVVLRAGDEDIVSKRRSRAAREDNQLGLRARRPVAVKPRDGRADCALRRKRRLRRQRKVARERLGYTDEQTGRCGVDDQISPDNTKSLVGAIEPHMFRAVCVNDSIAGNEILVGPEVRNGRIGRRMAAGSAGSPARDPRQRFGRATELPLRI